MKNEDINKELIPWYLQSLAALGYTVISDLYETIQSTPWSYVARFTTSVGYIYLKHTPELLALEPTIIKVLHEQFQENVPKVIAHNNHINCFLMQDAGSPLREILKHKFDVELYSKAINQFASMQIATADHINSFLDIGVPDWRLNKLPGLYMQLLAQNKMLIADGLSEKEIGELEALLPILKSLCKQLDTYGIKPSIVQPDFQDNNILIDNKTQVITCIDLGEIVISHPFFSLVGCLQQAKKHHTPTDKHDVYITLKNACLKNFTIYGAKKDLQDAFTIADHLRCIYQVLSYDRLMRACGLANLHLFYEHERLSTPLRKFITVCSQMHKP